MCAKTSLEAFGKAGVDKDLGQRDHHRLVRDEHPEQEEEEDDLGAGEAPARQHEPVQRPEDGRDERRGDDELEAVLEERQQPYCSPFHASRHASTDHFGQRPGAARISLGAALEAGHEQDVDGQQHDHARKHERRVLEDLRADPRRRLRLNCASRATDAVLMTPAPSGSWRSCTGSRATRPRRAERWRWPLPWRSPARRR